MSEKKTQKLSRAEVAKQVAAGLNTHYGKRVIATAAEVPNVYYLRRPSGIMQLDIDTGGGLPSALVHCISGPDGGGKTLLLYRYMAQQQKYYKQNCWNVLSAIEHPVDHFRLNRNGLRVAIPQTRIEMEVEQRKKLHRPPFTKEQIAGFKEQIGAFDLIHGETQEDTFQAILDLVTRCKKHGVYPNIIGLDSISAMTPKDSLQKEMDEHEKQAAHAMNVTKFFARYFPLVTQIDSDAPVDTTFICTQQVRSNKAKAEAASFMQKFLPDYKVAGAWALKHGKCFDILVTSGKKEKESDEGGSKSVARRMMRWELTKAKAGSHEGIQGEVQLDFTTNLAIDDETSVLLAGIRYGVLREAGKSLEWPDRKLKLTRAEFHAKLQADYLFDYDLRQAILEVNDISCAYFV